MGDAKVRENPGKRHPQRLLPPRAHGRFYLQGRMAARTEHRHLFPASFTCDVIDAMQG